MSADPREKAPIPLVKMDNEELCFIMSYSHCILTWNGFTLEAIKLEILDCVLHGG